MIDIRRVVSVRVDSSRPLFIEADSESFGRIFAHANSEEQVAILTAMMNGMKPHVLQNDYIAIELNKPEHSEVREWLVYLSQILED